MSFQNPAIIEQRYQQNSHYYYPEMKAKIEEVMANPDQPIEIPDNFISKSLEDSNFVFKIIQKIQILFQQIFNNVKCFFSSSYREGYKLAVKKIHKAYADKLNTISLLSHRIMASHSVMKEVKAEAASLKERVQKLTMEIRSGEETLQEKIDAKNLVVQQARALKEKKEHVPNAKEKFVGFFAALNPFKKGEATVDPEVVEIKALDAGFPVDSVDEETITLYDNEQFDRSHLINSIKSGKSDIATKKELLARTENELAGIKAILQTAEKNWHGALKEIQDKGLENFFDDEDFEVLSIEEETPGMAPATQKELTPQKLKLRDLTNAIVSKAECKDLGTLFSTLLKRLPEDAIAEWKCDEEGNFSLKLKESYSIWMPENNPKGGAVLLLGHETKGEITGKLEKNSILFTKGFNTFVKVPVLGYIAPTFDGILYGSRTDIRMGGTYLGQTQWNTKTFSTIKKDWEQNGFFIDNSYTGGYKKFLEQKIAEL